MSGCHHLELLSSEAACPQIHNLGRTRHLGQFFGLLQEPMLQQKADQSAQMTDTLREIADPPYANFLLIENPVAMHLGHLCCHLQQKTVPRHVHHSMQTLAVAHWGSRVHDETRSHFHVSQPPALHDTFSEQLDAMLSLSTAIISSSA